MAPLSLLHQSLGLLGGVAFIEPSALVVLKARLERAYAGVFCGGAAEVARAELLIKRSEYTSHAPYGDPFRLGKRIGMCTVLVVWIGWDVAVDFAWKQGDDLSRDFGECHTSASDLALINSTSTSIVHEWFIKDFPIYRGMLSLVVCLWLWAGLIYTWKKYARLSSSRGTISHCSNILLLPPSCQVSDQLPVRARHGSTAQRVGDANPYHRSQPQHPAPRLLRRPFQSAPVLSLP